MKRTDWSTIKRSVIQLVYVAMTIPEMIAEQKYSIGIVCVFLNIPFSHTMIVDDHCSGWTFSLIKVGFSTEWIKNSAEMNFCVNWWVLNFSLVSQNREKLSHSKHFRKLLKAAFFYADFRTCVIVGQLSLLFPNNNLRLN